MPFPSTTKQLSYFTLYRKDSSRRGKTIVLKLAGELMEKAEIAPGDRCLIEIEKAEGVGRITRGNQMGWLLRPVKPGAKLYHIRMAWKAEYGFPAIDRATELEVLLYGDGEIIFRMPKGEAAE